MASLFSEEFLLQCLWWLFGAATIFQMAFAGIVWYLFPRKNTIYTLPKPTPGASIVICARNEAHNLQKRLPLVLTQQYPDPWEVIVVDDASSDHSGAVLASLQKQYPHLVVVQVHKKVSPGKKAALSLGIQSARHNLLLLTDADCSPASAHWLRHMVAPMASDAACEVVLGCGLMTASPKGGFWEVWGRFEAVFVAMLYGTFAAAGVPYMGVGRNLAYRKDVWQKAGGFDAHLHYTGGDDDLTVGRLSNSRNTVCCFHPEAQVFSMPKNSFSTWFRQKRRHLSVSGGYRQRHLFWLGLQASTHAFQMVVGVLLLPWYPVAVITALLLRWVVGLVVFKRVSALLQASDLYPFFPMLDGLMGVFYTFFIPITWLLRRSNTW